MAKILLEYPDEMQVAVDEARGLVPRNAWIREAISLHLGDTPVRVPEPTPSKPPPRGAVKAQPPPRTDDATRQEQPVTRKYDHPFKSRGGFKAHLCFTCGEEHR